MKAAVLTQPRELKVEECSRPETAPDEVLVRVHSCGVCGTDSHLFLGEHLVSFPVVPGHEFSGTVEELGPQVRHLHRGDPVTVDPNIVCRVCPFCRRGETQLCEHLTAIGVNRNGGFAEYCVVPAEQAYPLPDGLPLESGAFVEPLACCLHGLDRAGFSPGLKVLILGGGSIGQLMLQLVRSGGATKVVLSEPNGNRRRLALQLGADMVVDPYESDSVPALEEATQGGADLTIECAGHEKAVEQAIAATRRGGVVLLFGVSGPEARVAVRPYDIFLRELTLVGSFVNPFTHQRAIEALTAGHVNPARLVSHRFSVDQTAEALRVSRTPEALKVLVQPEVIG
jgi:2-desacetyl-2-hydroxyethyl bacteriochlorophyllide A dehydrogenase